MNFLKDKRIKPEDITLEFAVDGRFTGEAFLKIFSED